MNAPSDSIECWADRPVVQLTKQVNRVIARPMNVVRMQFTGVAHVKTLALAILLGFIQTQTPQGRSETPSNLIWSIRRYPCTQDVRSTLSMPFRNWYGDALAQKAIV